MLMRSQAGEPRLVLGNVIEVAKVVGQVAIFAVVIIAIAMSDLFVVGG